MTSLAGHAQRKLRRGNTTNVICVLIVMTDHGHFLGEHAWWGKPCCPQYGAIAHIPLFIHVPGARGGTRTNALATHVDIHATILDIMGLHPPDPIDGVSLLPALRGEVDSVRDGALFGGWGSYVNWTDGRHVYMRAPATPDNQPLAFYTNRWSTAPWWRLPMPDDRTQFGRFMPRAGMPVGRQPVTANEMARLHVSVERLREGSLLFDLATDPDETRNLAGTPLELEIAPRLRALLERQGSPPEQFERLGLM